MNKYFIIIFPLQRPLAFLKDLIFVYFIRLGYYIYIYIYIYISLNLAFRYI